MENKESNPSDQSAVLNVLTPSIRGGARSAHSIANTLKWIRDGEGKKKDRVDQRRARRALIALHQERKVVKIVSAAGERWRRVAQKEA